MELSKAAGLFSGIGSVYHGRRFPATTLHSAYTPLQVKEIKILMSGKRVDDKFRKLFKEFAESMKTRGVTTQLRVMDSKVEEGVHDRWVLSKRKNFNIPSPDIVARGQYSEIKETTNRPPFQSGGPHQRTSSRTGIVLRNQRGIEQIR